MNVGLRISPPTHPTHLRTKAFKAKAQLEEALGIKEDEYTQDELIQEFGEQGIDITG